MAHVSEESPAAVHTLKHVASLQLSAVPLHAR